VGQGRRRVCIDSTSKITAYSKFEAALMDRNDQEKLYTGLLGLDGLHPGLKALNFVATILIGTWLAFYSWFSAMYNSVIYDLQPFAWPLIFLFAWPICAVILWLRLTGLKWRWGFFAAVLIFVLYFFIRAVANAIAWMMSWTSLPLKSNSISSSRPYSCWFCYCLFHSGPPQLASSIPDFPF